jgi:hypothetical protein
MEITWLAIVTSLVMGGAALLVFILAVKRDYFRNIEDIKYQVFWSDMEELVDSTDKGEEEQDNGAEYANKA